MRNIAALHIVAIKEEDTLLPKETNLGQKWRVYYLQQIWIYCKVAS